MSILINEELDLEKLILEAEQLVERRKSEALPLAEKAMLLAQQTNNPRHIAYANYILAFYYCLVENDYDQAIALCNKTLKTLATDDINEVGYKIYMALGNAYQMRGDVFAAHNTYMLGLKLLERLNELNTRQKGFAGSFYYNVSLLLTSEQNDEAEQYLLKAIELYEELNNGFKLSKSYIAYAGVLENRKEYNASIEYLFKALEIDQSLNDPYSIALTKANLCILHLRAGKSDEALTYLNHALNYYHEHKMIYETARTRMILGETLFAIGQRKEGIDELLKAEELLIGLENKRELSDIYNLLGHLHAEIEDHKLSAAYYKKHSEGLKDFYNTERERALTSARKEFETERKEKEATLLRQKNAEIQQYVRRLEVSNNELKQFAHVASHDLREPLRAITSYMDLLKRSLAGNLNNEQLDFIGFAINGAKRMDRLINDLLRLAKVDSNAQFAKINLHSVFTEIALNLETTIKAHNALILLPEELPEIVADRSQMLQLFQNLVANGIKYNKSSQPVIKVNCAVKQKFIEISVADNGIGIADEYRQKVFEIFQRLGATNETTGSGIGLTIVKKIVDKMNAKIWIEDNHPHGSIFIIRFPVAEPSIGAHL